MTDQLRADFASLQRAFNQRIQIFSGPGVNQLPKETAFCALRRIVKERWDFPGTLTRGDIATSHFASPTKIYAEFLQRDFGSYFHRLQLRPCNKSGSPIFVEQKLNRSRRKLAWMCRGLKKGKVITRFFFHWQSGKLQVVKDGKTLMVHGEKELWEMSPPELTSWFIAEQDKYDLKRRGKAGPPAPMQED